MTAPSKPDALSTLIAELRRLDAEATPGPWTHRRNHRPYRIVVFGGRKAYEDGYTTGDIKAGDAALIAEVRNLLPRLIRLLEAGERMAEVFSCRCSRNLGITCSFCEATSAWHEAAR